ncbi:MAG: hypothetical protein EON60_10775 [Alphaproteobacteria bacterium]|nr:MAG: hypothetical protein EON60_10775 [Alphaproteobacteria bacterium]
MVLENKGNDTKIPRMQIRRAIKMVRLSRRDPYPPCTALQRIGQQVEAAHKNYTVQEMAYKETMTELEKAVRAGDQQLQIVYARQLVEIDELVDMNVKRVLAQALCLEFLMHKKMDALEVEHFGRVLSD